MVPPKPAAPEVLVECDVLPGKCSALPVHECLVCEQRMIIAVIGNLDVRDVVCQPLLQASETVNSKFAGASRLLDLLARRCLLGEDTAGR